MRRWHEQVRNRVIMAPGPAQPDAVSGIEDRAILRSEEQKPRHRHVISTEPRPITVEHLAVADHPCGMLATASQRPAAVNTLAAMHGDSFAESAKRSAAKDMRSSAVNFPSSFWRQVAPEDAVCATDRQTPAGGRSGEAMHTALWGRAAPARRRGLQPGGARGRTVRGGGQER